MDERRLTENVFVRVAGSAPLRLVAEQLGVVIADPHEATIGGHVLELLGRVPDVGEAIELDGHRGEVIRVDGARITELAFRKRSPAWRRETEFRVEPTPPTGG